MIGHSLQLLKAMRTNTAEKWLHERIQKYGSISKLTLFGKPTVFIYGNEANKFVFTSDSSTISYSQTTSLKMILGDRCIAELCGQDHKRIRDALLSFLKPESLKNYVGKMDEEVRMHMETHWKGKQEITVLPLMKKLSFDVICSLLFGIEQGRTRRDKLVTWFQQMIGGIWSVPINLPFTRFNRGLRASARVRNFLKDLIAEKRMELKKGADPHQDLISCLLSTRDENNGEGMTEKEIVDNVILVLTAGHYTSAILITFMIRLLAIEPSIYAAVLQEQEGIAKSKPRGELLTWEDLAKMKYTWKVALETLRMFPPIFGGFRKAVKDIEYNGDIIPEGWQIFWTMNMTHMDDSIFTEPSKFDPTRFDNQASIPPYSFISFGGGPRMCPGYEFAKIEALVSIHYLVTQFTWKLSADTSFSRNPRLMPSEGLPIKIIPKK